jgi:hypothetical protein
MFYKSNDRCYHRSFISGGKVKTYDIGGNNLTLEVAQEM